MGYSNYKKKQQQLEIQLLIFIQEYIKILLSNHGRKFVNRILNVYLISINLKYILGSLHHPSKLRENLGFNKTVQKSLSTAYDNAKQENFEWDLELNLLHFLHFYN